MRIIIVEDDQLEEELVRKMLTSGQFKVPDGEIETIWTEADFYAKLDEIAGSPPRPDLVIMDVMMRWTDPAPEMPCAPDEVIQEGPTRAGLRCAEKLDKLNPAIPILFYTILEREDLDTDLFERRGLKETIDHVGRVDHARKGDHARKVEYARKDEDESDLKEKLWKFLPHPSRS